MKVLKRMSRAKLTIITLAATLVLSNAWWAYRSLDCGISLTYMRVSHDTAAAQLATAIAVANTLARKDYTKSDVIQAAQQASKYAQPFEKDGAVWVGQLGLRFDASKRFLKIILTAEAER